MSSRKQHGHNLRDRFEIIDRGENFKIRWRWTSARIALSSVAAVVAWIAYQWTSISTAYLSIVYLDDHYNFGGLSPLDEAGAAVWLLAALVTPVYWCLCMMANSTVVIIKQGEFKVAHQPLYWFGNHRVVAGQYERLYCVAQRSWRNKPSYVLVARLKNGRDLNLITGLTEPQAQFFLSEIERHLEVRPPAPARPSLSVVANA